MYFRLRASYLCITLKNSRKAQRFKRSKATFRTRVSLLTSTWLLKIRTAYKTFTFQVCEVCVEVPQICLFLIASRARLLCMCCTVELFQTIETVYVPLFNDPLWRPYLLAAAAVSRNYTFKVKWHCKDFSLEKKRQPRKTLLSAVFWEYLKTDLEFTSFQSERWQNTE